FVDGDFVSNIGYVLGVRGTIGVGRGCDPASTQFTCDGGTYCEPATLTCTLTACNDGADDDGDGLIDFPADPGCTGIDDQDETDDCPGGPTCPACGNGADDDGDGLVDYPDDPGCGSASGTIELDECAPGAGVLPLGD